VLILTTYDLDRYVYAGAAGLPGRITRSGLDTLGDTVRSAGRRYSARYCQIEPFEYPGSISVAPR
jgi:hypothetical protein